MLSAKSVLVYFILIAAIINRVDAQQSTVSGYLSAQIHADTSSINALNKRAGSFVQTNADSVLYYAGLANLLSQKLGYAQGEAAALLKLSSYHKNKADYTKSLNEALRAININDSLGLTSASAASNLHVAYVYKDLASQNRTVALLNKAMTYSKVALHQYRSIHNNPGIINSLNVCGIIYRDMHYALHKGSYYDTAMHCYDEAMSLVQSSREGSNQLGKLYNNLSQVYIEHKRDYPKGLDLLSKAMAFNKERNNTLSLCYNYGNAANAYLQLKEYGLAINNAQKMLVLATGLKQPGRKHDALYQLFQIYKQKGDAGEALRYYILADRITDSLTNEDKTKQIAELQTKYEAQKKDLHIRQLNTVNKRSNTKILSLTFILGVFILLVILMVWLYRKLQKQKQQISQQANRLETAMKELHHRVKNNLQIVSSLLSLQTYKLKDAHAISVLKESQLRVQAMSLIHQRLYKTDAITSVNMKEYITDLCESLMSAFGYDKLNFDLRLNIEKEMIDVDMAMPIGLILNEMITNAMKYAYEGIKEPCLIISFKSFDHQLLLVISDNGKGIDEQQWIKSGTTFGKQLISALSKQLRAQQYFSTTNGTEFKFIIPNFKAA